MAEKFCMGCLHAHTTGQFCSVSCERSFGEGRRVEREVCARKADKVAAAYKADRESVSTVKNANEYDWKSEDAYAYAKAEEAAEEIAESIRAVSTENISARDRWIGVDFDQTLRRDDGSPVPLMVARVKKWISEGIEVRIVTARLNPLNLGNPEYPGDQEQQVKMWCAHHIGTLLPVQYGKSTGMLELWDDRVVRVERDTGIRLSPSFAEED